MNAPAVRVLPYGDRALLVEVDDAAAVPGALDAVRALRLPGLVDLVPAARTVLVVLDPRVADLPTVAGRLSAMQPPAPGDAAPEEARTVVIDVVYDGVDLTDVAGRVGITVDDVVRRHGARTYRSAFCGFAPGFAYLTGLDPALAVPRLDTPRPRVPAGSVAIAAGWCGVYPREMPGGWRLLGRTTAVLWDLARDEPALLAPGTHVRFRAVG